MYKGWLAMKIFLSLCIFFKQLSGQKCSFAGAKEI